MNDTLFVDSKIIRSRDVNEEDLMQQELGRSTKYAIKTLIYDDFCVEKLMELSSHGDEC